MKRSCFTLIELVVVTSIMVLLMAVLFPALWNSKQQTKSAVCSSNVKQLTVALLMYETENQILPYSFNVERDSKGNPIKPPGGYAGDSVYDRTGWWWFNYITSYPKKGSVKNSVLWCPSRQVTDPLLKTNVLCENYGVNLLICKNSTDIPSSREESVGTLLRSSDIPHSGQTLLIVDSGYSLISWWHATDIPVPPGSREDASYVPGLHINADRYVWPGQEEDAINGRHPNKTVNIGFVDSHVEKRKAESLFVEKMADGYRNKKPLWQPK